MEADTLYKCTIHWSDGTTTHVRLQQKHIDNLEKTPIVKKVVRNAKV